LIFFATTFSLAYLAASLLTSGIGHLVRFARFRTLVREHGAVPARSASLASIAVVAFELAVGSSALGILLREDAGAFQGLLFGACAVAGVVFTGYVRWLLRHALPAASCGCSPFAGPLTPASIAPAAGLLLVSVLGLATVGLGSPLLPPIAHRSVDVFLALPFLWGITLAGIILLFPASMPQPTAGRSL
jgi:hypothetical protein